MHRSTGKIEGLYYDPGSQPYQQLILRPLDGIDDEGTVNERMALERAGKLAEDDDLYQADGVGRKKWWPAYELR